MGLALLEGGSASDAVPMSSAQPNKARGERIRTLRTQAGLSQDKLGSNVGVSRNAVSLWEKGGEITSSNLRALAAIFRTTIGYIDTGDQNESSPQRINDNLNVATKNQGAVGFTPEARGVDTWPRDLKIIGHVKAGVEGFFLDQGEIHGMAYRPPALRGVEKAFAVYVNDESMLPAFEPGWVAWIHPTKPVAPGNNVIVELSDGQAYIKRLVRRTAKQVVCMQWNPKEEVTYDLKKVKHVYLVVGSYREE